MQTKKRISGRTVSRDRPNGKLSRGQKKTCEMAKSAEKKAKDLITSSARKQKFGGAVPVTDENHVLTSHLPNKYVSLHEEISKASTGYDTIKDASDHHNGCEEGTPMFETIFSPAFHLSKLPGGEISNSGTVLSSEVSAIYLAMKNSNLECIDERSQDSMAAGLCVEDDEYEEFDDFDPYIFIKNLPELSSVVPTFRPLLLPRQTRSCPATTLVLDLDETLVHSSLEPCDDADFTFSVNFNEEEHIVYVRTRPYLREFMERVSKMFEIIIFTASQSIYAAQLLNVLDPKRKVFRHRVYRDSCVFVDGNYLKDLSVLGRDLAHVIIVDNSPQAFGFQVDNGVPIESWFDDRSDKELLLLLPFLESLVGVEDVRPLIAKKFNLREKIAAAVCPSLIANQGGPFER